MRNRIVESYAPLAEFFANRYRDRGVESDDLRQVAQLALIQAVDRFDPSFANQFSTFAGRTIDGELKRYFRDRTWAVGVPRGLKELSVEMRHLTDRLSIELGRSPTVADLAAASGHDGDDILAALDVGGAYRAASLDAPTGDGRPPGRPRRRPAADDPRFERTEARLAIQSLLADPEPVRPPHRRAPVLRRAVAGRDRPPARREPDAGVPPHPPRRWTTCGPTCAERAPGVSPARSAPAAR